jgi:purine-nucleoside phosphorylase
MTPTPHIESKEGDFASTVLMPGDPLRAKHIAENFLENVSTINKVRGMLAYTGTYKDKKISVMGSGMGMPSMGIYSFELFKFYNVDRIIRVGSCGAYSKDLNLYDVIIADQAWSESSFAKTLGVSTDDRLFASEELVSKLETEATKLGIDFVKACTHSSDVFYRQNFDDYKRIRDEEGCVVVEMEAFALFANAIATGKQAACIATVSDSLVTNQITTSDERQTAFTNMMKIALEMAE